VRYPSIDILRAIALVLMVVVHFTENLAGVDWLPGGLAAPLFTFLVGVSYRLWVNAQEANGKTDDEISKISIRRGLFLFVLGFAFNIVVWLPEDTFNWDVLTLIGASILLLTVVRNQPRTVPIVFAVAAFALAPVLQALVDYPAFWANGYFDPDASFPDMVIGFLAAGYFPLLPWLLFPLAGFVIGSLFFTNSPGHEPPTGRAALVGAGLVCLGGAAVLTNLCLPAQPAAVLLGAWSMFPASIAYATGTLGLAVMLFALGHRWVDPRAERIAKARVFVVVRTLSKYSLSLYVFHHIVHLWPLWIYGAAMGTHPHDFWRSTMPLGAAVALAILCLVAGFLLFRWMEQRERGGIESWMRYLCD
jgi:uncharacterized membrane protein